MTYGSLLYNDVTSQLVNLPVILSSCRTVDVPTRHPNKTFGIRDTIIESKKLNHLRLSKIIDIPILRVLLVQYNRALLARFSCF